MDELIADVDALLATPLVPSHIVKALSALRLKAVQMAKPQPTDEPEPVIATPVVQAQKVPKKTKPSTGAAQEWLSHLK